MKSNFSGLERLIGLLFMRMTQCWILKTNIFIHNCSALMGKSPIVCAPQGLPTKCLFLYCSLFTNANKPVKELENIHYEPLWRNDSRLQCCHTVAFHLDHTLCLWRQLSNATVPPAPHSLLIHHFTNKDRSTVVLTRPSLWYVFFVLHATSEHITVSLLSLTTTSRSSPLQLVCTQRRHDVGCNHRWTQFQGQFEDYSLLLVNKIINKK